MSFLKISVSRPVENQAGKFKDLFRQSIPYDESIQFPFERVLSSLRVLFPFKDIIINITLM